MTAADVDARVIDSDRASTAIRVTLAPNGAVPEGTGPAGQEITFTAQLNGAARSVDTALPRRRNGNGDDGLRPVAPLTLTIEDGEIRARTTITFRPVDDDIDDVNETVRVTASTASDLTLSPGTLPITIIDDDTRGVVVEPTSLAFAEGGSDIYTVVLTSEPTVAVTVTPDVTGNDDVTTVQTLLTFTPSNWDDQQTVTVDGAEDEDAVDDTATVEHAVSGGDYGGA